MNPHDKHNKPTTLLGILSGVLLTFTIFKIYGSSTNETKAILETSPPSIISSPISEQSPNFMQAPQALNSPQTSPKKESESETEINHDQYQVDPYRELPILASHETQPDPNGNFTRTRLIQTSSKYPQLKVVENLTRNFSSGEDQVTNRVSMIADHVLVKLEPEYSDEEFRDFITKNGFQIRQFKPYSKTYLISFESNSIDGLESTLAQFQKNKMVKISEPDYVFQMRD